MRDGDKAPGGQESGEAAIGREVPAPGPTPRVVVRARDGASSLEGMADTALSPPAGHGHAQAPATASLAIDFDDDQDAAAQAAAAQSAGAQSGDEPDDEAELADSLTGELLLERYRVTAKVGQGGMGAVYEAVHTLLGKRVAVKVLLDKHAHKDQVVARLEQEARLASSIGNEHIIDITDVGETRDGRPFVVMEYLDGQSLAECVTREGPLPEDRAIRIAQQVASALRAAHAKGILHRDVKPENVFLLERRGEDYVKVVDFGISKSMRGGDGGTLPARLTQTGMVLGTPLYMSPEQARGDDDLDERIDIYALGVILYEMVTGEVPFRGSNYLNIIARVLNDEPTRPRALRPELSAELEAVILRAMAKERVDRYPSCEALAEDLRLLADDPGRATGRRPIRVPSQRGARQSGLHPLAWAAGIAVIVGAVAVTVGALLSDSTPQSGPVPGMGQQPADAAPTPDVIVPRVEDTSPPPLPDTPPLARLHLVSSPPGARIYEGARMLGTTPLDIELPREQRTIELIAELEGHDDASFSINPYVDEDKEITVRLKKPKRGHGIRKLPRKPATTPPVIETPAQPGTTQSSGTASQELSGNPYRRTPE